MVATSETAPRRLQPSSSSAAASPKSAIDLASARRRRPSLTAAMSAVPPAKAATTKTTTASSPSTEASMSNAHSPSSSSAHKAAANSATTSKNPSRPISLDQLPRPLRDSVVVLSAPNPRAPGGQTPVYVLGVSHVSKRSLDRVSLEMVSTATTVLARSRFALS